MLVLPSRTIPLRVECTGTIWCSREKKSGRKNWREVGQVMITKRRAALRWRNNGNKHVAIWNRLIDLQMMKNQGVVTMEPDP